MTQNMQRLADMAAKIAPPGAVTEDEAGFAVDANGTTLEIFSPGEASYAGYCRAAVARLGDGEFPAAFAEEALMGNFFWRGTNGAVLSLDETENAVYLTDRFDDGAFEDEVAFKAYLDGFLAALGNWRERIALYVPAADLERPAMPETDDDGKEVS